MWVSSLPSSKDDYSFEPNENESSEWQSEELGSKGPWVSSSDLIETLKESDDDRHCTDYLMMDKEEETSPLKDVKEVSNLIIVDSSHTYARESSNFLGMENEKTGLKSIPLLKSLEGWHIKLMKSFFQLRNSRN